MISFHTQNITFNLGNKLLLKNWLKKTISSACGGKKCGEINIIFCNDEYLVELNKKYLKRNYYTDVIAFSYSDNPPSPPLQRGNKRGICGDIFISIDRVKENAKKYKVSFKQELYRVIIHGVLHLIGYDDKTKKKKEIMRKKEELYLKKFNK